MANVKITIDRDECVSCESCWTICPEVFEQNSLDSFSQIVEKYQVGSNPAEGDAPEDMRDKARDEKKGIDQKAFNNMRTPARTTSHPT